MGPSQRPQLFCGGIWQGSFAVDLKAKIGQKTLTIIQIAIFLQLSKRIKKPCYNRYAMKHSSTALLGNLKKILKGVFHSRSRIPNGRDMAMVALAASAKGGGEITLINIAFVNTGRRVVLKAEESEFIVQVEENDQKISSSAFQKSDPKFIEKIGRILMRQSLLSGEVATTDETDGRMHSPELNN